MALIGSLVVNVKAQTAQFLKGIGSARSLLAGFAGTAVGVTSALGGFNLGLASSVAASAILVKGQFEVVDSLGKMAQRLGVSTEAIAGYEVAARLSGATMEDVDKAVTHLNRHLGGLQIGAKDSEKAFRELGLKAEDFVGVGTEKAVEKIADRLKELPNAMQRARLSAEFLGKGGERIRIMLEGGAEGLRAAEAEAKKFGLSFSQKNFRAIEEANDNMTRLKLQMEGIARQVAIELAPAIIAITQQLLTMEPVWANIGALITAAFSATDDFTRGLTTIQIAGINIYQSFLNINTVFLGLVENAAEFARLAAGTLGANAETIAQFQAIQDRAREQRAAVIQERAAVQQMVEGLFAEGARNPQADALEAARKKIEEMQEKAKEFAKAMEEAARQAEIIARGKKLQDALLTPAEKFRKTIKDLTDLVWSRAIDKATLGRAAEQAFEQLRGAQHLTEIPAMEAKLRGGGAAQLAEVQAQRSQLLGAAAGQTVADILRNEAAKEQERAGKRDALLKQIVAALGAEG